MLATGWRSCGWSAAADEAAYSGLGRLGPLGPAPRGPAPSGLLVPGVRVPTCPDGEARPAQIADVESPDGAVQCRHERSAVLALPGSDDMDEHTSGGSALAALSDALADAVEQAGRSVVRVEARHRQPASGIAWSSDGLVVTADHVLERDEDILAGLPDGRTARARVVGRDPGSDLALLRVDAEGLPPIARGGTARVGSFGLIVARPGLDLMASLGTISAVSGPVRIRRGGQLDGLIATDATFYPGFSGAPLVGGSGAALGLATSRFGRGRGAGAVIPTSAVERVVAALSAHGRVRRGFLGLGSQPVELPEALRQRAGLGEQLTGLLVVSVEAGGPADRAGLLLGDVVVALGGEPVRDTGELRDLLGGHHAGAETTLRIIRGGEPRELTVTIGERA